MLKTIRLKLYMSTSNRVIKNTIYLYIKSMVSMVVMLFVTRIVLQALGVVDYGIYNVVAGSIAILGFFRNSLSVTMQRFLNHYQGENNFVRQKQVFNIGVVFHWIVAFLLVIFFIILGFFLFNGILNIPYDRVNAAKIVYLCLIVNTFFTVITAPYDAAITAHENMFFYSIVGIFESFLKLAVAFFIIYTSGDKLIIYAILMMAIPFVEIVIMRVYCKIHYLECVFHPKKEWNVILAKKMINFAGWSLVGSTANVVGNHGANLTLNHFFGAAINAVTGIANQIQGVLAVLLNGLIKSLTPIIFKSEGSGNMENMIQISMLGCKYSTLLFSLLAIPVFAYVPEILKIWLGDVPEWAVLFVRLQLVRAFVEQLGLSLQSSLNATGYIRQLNLIACIYNLLPLLILIVLYKLGCSPYWHYIVMIAVLSIGQNITLLFLCKKHCKLSVNEYMKKVLLPNCCVLLTFLPLYIIKDSIGISVLSLILSVILFVTMYMFIVYLGFSFIEKQYLFSSILSFKNRIFKAKE